MSKKQWNNGYWTGYNDAKNGKQDLLISEKAELAIAWMCDKNRDCVDCSLFRVWRLVAAIGYEGEARNIYNYILKNEPLGCYIGGEYGNGWMDDWFVLPNFTAKDCEEIRQNIKERTKADTLS